MDIKKTVKTITGAAGIVSGIYLIGKCIKELNRSILRDRRELRSLHYQYGYFIGRLSADQEFVEYCKKHNPEMYKQLMNEKEES